MLVECNFFHISCWTEDLLCDKTTRTLRIFLSHTVSDQAWQNAGQAASDAPNFETGQGIPSWTFKIEGRLLDVRLSENLDMRYV